MSDVRWKEAAGSMLHAHDHLAFGVARFEIGERLFRLREWKDVVDGRRGTSRISAASGPPYRVKTKALMAQVYSDSLNQATVVGAGNCCCADNPGHAEYWGDCDA